MRLLTRHTLCRNLSSTLKAIYCRYSTGRWSDRAWCGVMKLQARRPYCKRNDRWMQDSTMKFSSANGVGFHPVSRRKQRSSVKKIISREAFDSPPDPEGRLVVQSRAAIFVEERDYVLQLSPALKREQLTPVYQTKGVLSRLSLHDRYLCCSGSVRTRNPFLHWLVAMHHDA